MTDVALGVVFRPQSPPERLREVAQAAEAAGIAQLWLWEDCFFEGGLTTPRAKGHQVALDRLTKCSNR